MALTSYDDARARLIDDAVARLVPLEKIPLASACGRTLALDLHAPFAVPGFANAAMDGYAVAAGPENVLPRQEFQCLDLVLAGQMAEGSQRIRQQALSIGSCVEVATGALLPEGADTVIPYEMARREGPLSPADIMTTLITGIRSDLPGQITAQVTQHIYDSPTGSILLIPQGTRIIGQYDNGVAFGQRRVLLVWNRLIFPNGRSIVLERQPGADTAGYAGLEDGVDYHWWELMQAAGLSTLLAIGTELTTDDDDRLIEAIRGGAGDTIADAGEQIIQRQLQVAPTLTIRPGFPMRVIVTRDLVLEPYGTGQ